MKRFFAQRLLGLALVVTLAFAIGVLVAGPIYADAAREAIVASAIGSAPVSVANARFDLTASAGMDYAFADRVVTAAIGSLRAEAVVRQGLSTVRVGSATGPSAPLVFRDGAERHLSLQGGPPSEGSAAVSQGAAAMFGLRPGSRLVLVGPDGSRATLTVSGIYAPVDPTDRFWFGTRSPFPSPDAQQQQPIVVGRATYVRLSSKFRLTNDYSWDVYLRLQNRPFADVSLLPGELLAAKATMAADPTLPTVRLFTGLDTLMELVSQRVQHLRVPILLVVFQIAVVALAVLAGVGALVLTRQSFELAILHSRGFSRRFLLITQGLQATLAAVISFPLGLLIGIGLAKLAARANGSTLPSHLFPVRLSASAELLGLGIAAAAVAVLTALSVPVVRRTVLEQRHAVSREDRPLLARVPVELIVGPVGLFAFLQLRSQPTAPDPISGLDPLLLIAPTLLIFAASFLALRSLLFALRRMDGAIGRSKRVGLYLAARRVSRSPGIGFASALLLLLSTGLVMVATSYRATVVRSHSDTARQQLGSDWSVQIAAPGQPLVTLRRLPAHTTPVIRTPPTLPAGGFPTAPEVLAVDPSTYAGGGWWRSDAASQPLEGLLAGLRVPALGVPVPQGAASVSLTIASPETIHGLRVAVTSEAADGTISTSDRPLVAGGSTYDVPLGGAVRLLSIVWVSDTTLDLPPTLTFDIASVAIDGEPLSLQGWDAITWRGSRGTVKPEGQGGLVDRFSPGVGDVIGGIEPAQPVVPAVVSPEIDAAEGASFTAGIGGQSVAIRRIAVASAWPGEAPATPFIVVSAPALLERQAAIPEAGIGVSEIWASGATDPRPALRRAGITPGTTTNTRSIVAGLSALPQSLAVGMLVTASAGGLSLVVIGVALGLYFAQRRRDYEFAALRAMGAEDAQIRSTLVLEQVGLLGFAAAAGLAIGYAMLRIMMPYLARSLASAYPVPLLTLDARALAIAALAMIVASALGLMLAMRSLLRSSVTGVLRGEAE